MYSVCYFFYSEKKHLKRQAKNFPTPATEWRRRSSTPGAPSRPIASPEGQLASHELRIDEGMEKKGKSAPEIIETGVHALGDGASTSGPLMTIFKKGQYSGGSTQAAQPYFPLGDYSRRIRVHINTSK